MEIWRKNKKTHREDLVQGEMSAWIFRNPGTKSHFHIWKNTQTCMEHFQGTALENE